MLQTIIVLIGLILLIGISAILISIRLYQKTPANMAFIRTGFGGKKVVLDGGAIIIPFLHEIKWISLETMKLEVIRANREAFITKDRFRVDIGAEFYLQVESDPECIERASRSLGEKSLNAQSIKGLIEEKLVSALRAVVANRTLTELHEKREDFALAVQDNLRDALLQNGLSLENVSIFALDQTAVDYLDPNNIFDAEGLKQITAQTSERKRERNEIERNTEVAIKRKDVESVKLKLSLDQEREFAEAEQYKEVESNRALRRAETEQFKYQQEKITREAEIARDKAIREAEIEREAYLKQKQAESEKLSREAEIMKEAYLVVRAQEKELQEIEKDRVLEEAKREKEIGILRKEQEKLAEEKARLETEATKELAAQEVISVNQKAEAERAKLISLIEATQELEVTEQKAKAIERLAQSRMKEGEATAYATYKLKEAENITELKFIYRDLLLSLIDKAPTIMSELMTPAKNIDSIKVLDIRGWGGGTGDDSVPANGIQRVIDVFLHAGAALPFFKELLEFAKIDPGNLTQKILEQVTPLIKTDQTSEKKNTTEGG
jgi:uncharacterized membrane protein YqiK